MKLSFVKTSGIFIFAVMGVFLLSAVGVYARDFDGDGLSDEEELYRYHTDPFIADTDGDGINDATEVAFWRGDWNADFDGDGIPNLLDYDSDNDGFSDGEELKAGSNPGNPESIPLNPPLFSVHKLVVGFGFQEGYQGWIDVLGRGYAHERWLQVNWPDFNASGGATRIASGDVDGDGKDEIVIGLGPVDAIPGLPGGVFELLDDDFTHLAWGQIGWSDYNALNGETWPAVGDMDGDGKAEIIMGLGPGGQGKVEIFTYSSAEGLTHKSWATGNWEDYNRISGETRPAAGDLDGDGKDEIVIGLGPVTSEPALPEGLFEVLSSNLTHLSWGGIEWPDYNALNGETWPAVGDMDGDGKDEMIMGLGRDGGGRFETFRLEESLVLHTNWGGIPWEDYAMLYGETHPTSADVDFDGKHEIIVGLGSGGDNWIDILDDASTDHALIRSVQTETAAYGELSGETWPAVRSARPSSKEDSDGDGLTDEEEVLLGLNPNNADTDGDGIPDGYELGYGTNPLLADTDGDGYSDFEELQMGSDPLNASSVPGSGDDGTPGTLPGVLKGALSVTLTWDPNTEADLAGYKIYYGSESRNYTSHTDVGNQTTYTVSNLPAGNRYYFAAKAYNTAGQESDYSEEVVYLSGLPSAATGAASAVTFESATLNATINPGGGETSVVFEYGASDSYGNTVNAVQSPISGTVDEAVTVQISGLASSQTYHFRVVATNAAGTAAGSDMTFTTEEAVPKGIAPSAVTGLASDISSYSATLSAVVNPGGAETVVIFEYGASDSYGNTVNAIQSPMNGAAEQTATAQITGLNPSGVYHFRVVASNSAGSAGGDNHVFTNVDRNGKMILIGPSGTIFESSPTYSWYAVPNAKYYHLSAKDSVRGKMDQQCSAQEAGCSSGQGICSITPGAAFSSGSCKWKAQPVFEGAPTGRWSDEMLFTIQ